MRIGYVGLGNIGGAIARRLHAAGFDVLVWARRPEALEPFREGGIRTVRTLGELARYVDVVGVCVVDDQAVVDVCNRELVSALGPGTRIVVQSTVLPSTCRAIAELAEASGCGVVDAPVSGGADGAERGQLSLLVGGDREDVRACAPMFEALGGFRHLGRLGSGQIAKLSSNALYTASIGTTLSALAAGEQLGLAAQVLRRVLETTTARSFVMSRLPRLTDHDFVDHAVAMLTKDLHLFSRLCDEDGVDVAALVAMAHEGLRALKAWESTPWTSSQPDLVF